MDKENGQKGTEAQEARKSLADLGAAVKALREEKNISLDEVSQATCIRKNLLEDVESGDFSRFKALTYARGFVRNYLEYLEAPELWKEYSSQLTLDIFGEVQSGGVYRASTPLEVPGSRTMALQPRGFRHSKARRNLIVLLFIVAAAAVALVGYNWGHIGGEISKVQQQQSMAVMKDRQADQSRYDEQRAAEEEEIERARAAQSEGKEGVGAEAAVSEDATLSADEEPVPPVQPSSEPEAAPAPEPTLAIRASGTCWLQVSSGKKTLFTGTVKKGWERTFSLDGSLSVRYGAAQNVTVSHNGAEFAVPGKGVLSMEYGADGTSRKK
ncbi:MAG: helix-turn-helix domain-containing protein [Pyramidobacter sp.]|jgi:cytoskeleton protein RodZ